MRIAPVFLLCGALTLAVAAHGETRVGVTSQTNGDPLGKPPTQDERVLRVGIDIQANELITTHSDDRAHLVFLDGTSLTVGPNAQLKVDRFVYDPSSRTGDLAVTVGQGVFRLVGGKISKTTPIIVTTPSSTIGIRGGIGLFSVDPHHTTSQFLFGISMTVTAQGHVETATRPGSQITTLAGGLPSTPSLIPTGGLTKTFGLLEAHSGTGSNAGTADHQAQQSGFSDENSGKGPIGQLPTFMNTAGLAQTINSAVLSQSRQQILTNSATLPAPAATQSPTPVSSPSGGLLSSSPPPPPPPPPSIPGCYDDDSRHHLHFTDSRFRR